MWDDLSSTPGPILALMGTPVSPEASPLSLTPTSSAAGTSGGTLNLADLRASGFYVDAGLCMGRSFRVGWGPDGTLVFPGEQSTGTGCMHAAQQTDAPVSDMLACRACSASLCSGE